METVGIGSSEWMRFRIEAARLRGRWKKLLWSPPLPKTGGRVNLHLGCGFIDHPEYINVDAFPMKHVHHVRRIDDLSPFPDESVDLIYACHCLEHFPHRKVPKVIAGWRRKLKEGGVLRLSVPDFDLLLAIYEDTGRDMDSIVGVLMGAQADRFDCHYTSFNRASLERLLLQGGFREVRPWQPGSSSLTTMDDWSGRLLMVRGKQYPISLNLEAVR